MSISASIKFEEEDLKATFVSDDFNFQELDNWVRSRFGLKPEESLRYMDKLGEEIVPSKGYIKSKETVYIKKIKKQTTSPPLKSQNNQLLFSYSFLFLTTFILFLGLYGEKYYSDLFRIKALCSQVDTLLISSGILNKKGITLEAFMATISWSSTYLFIRRLWNPETSSATFEKYAADSFFGGLAAGASIFLKALLLQSLS